MVEALINIVAVIAIIAIGAFVIVVLSDLLISIIDGKNGIFFKRGNKKEQVKEEEDLPERPKIVNRPLEEEKPQETPQIAFQSNIDMNKAEKEEKLAAQKDEFDFSSFVEEPVDNHSQKANEAYIDEITEIAKTMLDNEEVMAADSEEIIDEEETSNEEIQAMRAELEEQRKAYEALLAQKQQLESANQNLESEKESLQKALEEQAQVQEEKQEQTSKPTESLEELTARLEMLEDRLKTNEKALKANKKEYLPLAKIKKSFENDTKKLRRKDAKVAKQKVMLYGVNNFVDIDEEKAKELNEELDLLEGLRLSVKHCEEVLAANKDRLPILEQTNQILTKTVQDIKSDIADVKSKIAALKNTEDAE